MTAPRARLRLSGRSIVLAVVLLGATLALLRVLAASGRVIGWVLAAATLAGLLYPLVQLLARRMPRWAALLLVMLLVVGASAMVAAAVVRNVSDQLHELQQVAPSAARRLERSDRYGDAAREFHLTRRVRTFVDELPKRLQGGDVQQALRSAATRGVAFLATGVLTIFFLIHGHRLVEAAVKQLPVAARPRWRRFGAAVYERTWHYVAGSLVMAIMAGLLAYGCAVLADVPAPAALALWMGVFDVVPLLGVAVGALPVVLLALAFGSLAKAMVVLVVLVGWQLVEAFYLQRRVEAMSVHIGPFVTVAVGMVGLELYGIGGALVGLVLAVLGATAVDELVP
jgi:predicted PurR-regulated permease PerM